MKLSLWLALLLGGVVAASAAPASAPLTCVVCAQPITGKYFVLRETNNICAVCEQLPTRCAVYSLPVKDGFTKTADGRFLCQRDAPNVVLSEEEGRQLFTQTARELSELSGGTLALRATPVNVQVLFNLDFTDNRSGTNANGGMHRMGFSLSRRVGETFTHNVVLLNGQPRPQTRSTCAHEFGHLWLTENLPPARQLDPDSREALCELLAFKLAGKRGDSAETARIKANPYTKGAILNALAFEEREGLAAVLTWARSGTSPALPAAGESASLAATPSVPLRPPELRPPPPPATKLELRSLLRTTKRTVAVINNERFEPGAEIPMLINGQRLRVKLESVEDNAVTVTVDGVKRTLRLGEK